MNVVLLESYQLPEWTGGPVRLAPWGNPDMSCHLDGCFCPPCSSEALGRSQCGTADMTCSPEAAPLRIVSLFRLSKGPPLKPDVQRLFLPTSSPCVPHLSQDVPTSRRHLTLTLYCSLRDQGTFPGDLNSCPNWFSLFPMTSSDWILLQLLPSLFNF